MNVQIYPLFLTFFKKLNELTFFVCLLYAKTVTNVMSILWSELHLRSVELSRFILPSIMKYRINCEFIEPRVHDIGTRGICSSIHLTVTKLFSAISENSSIYALCKSQNL